MQLPILGTIKTTIPINFADNISTPSEKASTPFITPKAKATPTSEPQRNAPPTPPLTAEMQAALLALQEDTTPQSPVKSVNINGLSIIISGHSVDAREGVSLLRTASVSETRAMMDDIAAMEEGTDDAGDTGSRQKVKSDNKIIRLDHQGLMVEIASEALDARPEGATGAYMNEDFFHTRGRWTNGNPLELSNSETSIRDQQRSRLETLMNSVDAERKLQAEYGNDIKLVYSHVDQSFIMLTPDDAQYDTLQSAESGVQTVIDEVHRGFVDKTMASEILQQYGYQV